ncbi:unnamed protein product [Cuscuta europaea]|uniref:Uncharacterized protein n=1 Tax=Cuscuta europaea TaxID=41803 RepID=A0A9P0YJE3_CUSEU|nr:unnamed protein product [Cuscuta europaea]
MCSAKNPLFSSPVNIPTNFNDDPPTFVQCTDSHLFDLSEFLSGDARNAECFKIEGFAPEGSRNEIRVLSKTSASSEHHPKRHPHGVYGCRVAAAERDDGARHRE